MNNEFHKFPLILKSIDEEGVFSGYASVYNVQDNHNDIIISGAFCNSLKKQKYGRDIKLLWQHNVDEPIGVFTKMVEDDIGLYVEGRLLLNIEKAKEVYSLIEAGAVDGLSIGFTIKDFEINEDTGTRIIFEADLWEVSIVTFPANEEARVTSFKTSKRSKQKINTDKDEIVTLEDSISRAFDCLQ